ncbi:hypothetical protein [Streptomyces sp. NPDC001480]|uniref:hypothetical protein n=1 Tax=Streptomyces sp. NPDC001480 TaxID=3364577 RepID=UPI0036CF10CF
MTLTTERPTVSGTGSDSFEAMLDLLDELNVPDGYKAEIIKGHRRVAVVEGLLHPCDASGVQATGVSSARETSDRPWVA